MEPNSLFREIFPVSKPVIAMLHVFSGRPEVQIAQALDDLKRLQPFVDGAIVENYGWGYQDENLASGKTHGRLMKITEAVVEAAEIPIGVNALPNDYEMSLHIAKSAGGRFIQMDHVTGEFAECLAVDPDELRKIRGCYPEIAILGGVHPKYYGLADPAKPIAESARTAMSLADAVVVTGEHTGGETNLRDIRAAKEAVGNHPIVIGSGLNSRNAASQLSIADGAIVGSAFKKNGVRSGEPIDTDLVRSLMEQVAKAR